jgi:hypothetical protein
LHVKACFIDVILFSLKISMLRIAFNKKSQQGECICSNKVVDGC